MRQPKVGDTVKITTDAALLHGMECGYFPEHMSHLPGRLMRVTRVNYPGEIEAVLTVPTELDITLGIASLLDDYWWDLNCVEVVEEATDAEA